MKILIYNWRDLKHEWAGGSEIYITEIAKRLMLKGNEVTLFCGQGIHGNLPEREVVNGIEIIRKGGKYSVYLYAMKEYLLNFRHKFDVVVDAQNGIPFFTVLFSTKPKVAIVHHVHGKQFTEELTFPYSYIGYVIEKFVFPIIYKRTKVITVSQSTKEALIKNGIPVKNIEVVYNAIDKTHPGGIKEKYKKPTILYLGRIKRYKRVDMIVDMMPKIIEKVPDANLIIAGWGTEGAFVTEMLMQKKLRKRVKILGKVSEAEKRMILSKSWVFVNPSIGEGWGISVIEANYHGTPTVVFNVPGLSESVKNNTTGYVCETEEEFLESVVKLLTDGALREKFEKNSIEWAKKYSWDVSADKFLKVIESVSK